MKAEIISIGSELTSGQNLDTNSQWLSRHLAKIGIPVGWHTTVADDVEDNVSVFRSATQRAGLVLITGGLGPTQDDLTRDALARLAGVELVLHPELLHQIEQRFASRQRIMPERNRVQAMLPAGAEVLANSLGTAPGVWLHAGDCLIAAMPGVPSEMHAMFENEVRPRLCQLGLGRMVLVEQKINCFGAGESAIEEKLLDLTRRGHVPEVGITASDATISLRIRALAANRQEALAQIAPVEQNIRERLGDLVFGVDDEELHDVVVRLLADKRLTIGTAESITAGQVAERLGRVPGVSAYLMGAIVAYDNRVKMDLLGVPEEMLREHGAVSAPVVEAMAAGCRMRLQTDLAISTSGIAGPSGATPTKPVGLVYVGLAWNGGVTSQRSIWGGTRTEVQSRTAKMALNLARMHLMTSNECRVTSAEC